MHFFLTKKKKVLNLSNTWITNQRRNSTAGQNETVNNSTRGYGVSSLLMPPCISEI